MLLCIAKKKMFKKKFKTFLALTMCMVITTVFLGGCAQKKETTKSGVVSFKVSNWPVEEADPDKFELYENYLADMKKAHPDIEIIPSDYIYGIDTFLPLAASGQLPNLYYTAFTEPAKVIEAGYAKDITDIVKAKGIDKKISPQMLDVVTKNGRIYGIPVSGYGESLCFNMDIMRKAGMVNEDGTPKVPKTWVELAEMAREIKKKTGIPGFTMITASGWLFMNIAWSYGVDFMEKIDGKWVAQFNTPETVEAMEFVRDLRWKYDAIPEDLIISYGEDTKLVALGQAAMCITTEGSAPGMTKNYKLPLDRLAFAPLPAGPKGRYAQIGGSAALFSVETTDEQVEAALEWMDLIGQGATFTEDIKARTENTIRLNYNDNLPVIKPSFRIWSDQERIDSEDELYDKYKNVDEKFYGNTIEGVTLREEEPVEAKQLYYVLGSILQEVLINKDADIQKLLDKANEKFQRDFLDEAE